MGQHGSILSVSGPVVRAHALGPVRMFEVARVGREELIGEVVRLQNDVVDIQVQPHADGIGGDQIIHIAILIHRHLRIARAR